ncbi:hypothetical protein NEFER03_0450 [Nematocida sp. LUAm3]|nr:hypothetical protein NEFER03_0450 [Nematocida sp. LUAm3]KAI5175908.1 hypothetical protein NEFER02_1768 [Nematocida sp. LUAm2]KAI5178710.1 hypothetical protein NEFER01_1829 [Nematocida sp. LUAm1]
MFAEAELWSISQCKDVQLLVELLEKWGEALKYLQGTISIAQKVLYTIIIRAYRKKNTYKFIGAGCFISGILNISGKLQNIHRKITAALLETEELQEVFFGAAAVNKVEIENHVALEFTNSIPTPYKEILPDVLLQTEVIICSLLEFQFNYVDVHEILWEKLGERYPVDLKKKAWIVLSDMYRYPLFFYFSHDDLVDAATYMAIRLHNSIVDKKIELPESNEKITVIEEKMLTIYLRQ